MSEPCPLCAGSGAYRVLNSDIDPCTFCEGSGYVYTLVDVEAAVRWAFRYSVPTCVDDALCSSGEDAMWQAYRKTLEGEGDD